MCVHARPRKFRVLIFSFASGRQSGLRAQLQSKGKQNKERIIHISFFPQETTSNQVKLSMDASKSVTSKFENALVGFVFDCNPFLGKMKAFVRSKWGSANVVKVSLLTEGIFLLSFSDPETKTEVLVNGPWTFDKKPFILKQWSDDEVYNYRNARSLHVWIRLPNIKPHLTHPNILSRLCSTLGRPICTDRATAEGSSFIFARVCVEVSADRELREKIVYKDPYGNAYTQEVVYEYRPLRCENCLSFGHVNDSCPEERFDDGLLKSVKDAEEEEKHRKVKKTHSTCLELKRDSKGKMKDGDKIKKNPGIKEANEEGQNKTKDLKIFGLKEQQDSQRGEHSGPGEY